MSYRLIRKAQQCVAAERGPAVKSPEGRVQMAIAFPNTYFVGMSNLGIHAVYRHVNAHLGAVCERVFLPESADFAEFERSNLPLFSLESQRPIRDFHCLGFSLTFEEDYINVLRILKLGHIALHVADRSDDEPIVIAGGPCASSNPEPMTDFIDAFVIGDGEPVLDRILDIMYALTFPTGSEGVARRPRPSRAEVLQALSAIPGLYVPSVTGHTARIVRQSVRDLNVCLAETVPLTFTTEFAGVHLVEIARGCPRKCRFCNITYTCLPLRLASPDRICKAIRIRRHDTNRVGLVGASVSDYPDIVALCRALVGSGCNLHLPSLRPDRMSDDLLDVIRQGGQRSLTIAPEAATERLRGIVSKHISNEQIVDCIARASRKGFHHFKLYFMLGLPGEDDTDIEPVSRFVTELLRAAPEVEQLSLMFTPFVPKPFTPFQWAAMECESALRRKAREIRAMLRGQRHVDVRIKGSAGCEVQAFLSLGDHSAGQVIEGALTRGGNLHAWKTAAEESGIDWDNSIHTPRPRDHCFPYAHIDCGVSMEQLWREYERSVPLQTRIARSADSTSTYRN